MSSKVLLKEDSRGQVTAMVWASHGATARAATPRSAPVPFQPAVSMNPEVAALRNRVIEIERAGRNAIEAARRQAFTEGEAEGRRQANEEVEPVLQRLASSLEAIANLKPRLREEAESDVVQLSLAIARRILHRELSVEPTAIQALVQVALDRLAKQEIYRVRVNPAQQKAITAALSAHHGATEILADPRLEIGALIFETNRGKMDASVSAQLEEIERGLTDRVKPA